MQHTNGSRKDGGRRTHSGRFDPGWLACAAGIAAGFSLGLAGPALAQEPPSALRPPTGPATPGPLAPSTPPKPASTAAVNSPAPATPGQISRAGDGPREIVAEPTVADVKEQAARAVARLAMLDLRSQDEASQLDYQIAALLLDQAGEMDPQNAEILRRRIEAHFNAGNDRDVLALSRELLRLDPRDTVAQLRVITARLAQIQTVEDRLVAYKRFLSEEGAAFDPSVRSRLALDAALLAREAGDDAGFMTLLEQSASLDSTNKNAALLALSVFSDRVDSATGRLELLANLLYADPLDPRVHHQIRDALVAAGAFEQAGRFHANGSRIMAAAGAQDDQSRVVLASVLDWYTRGAQSPLDAMRTQLLVDRDRADRMAKSQETTTGLVTVKRGSEVFLPMSFEAVRLTAAIATRDMAEVERSLSDLEASVLERETLLADRGRRPINMTDAQALADSSRLKSELQRWRLLANAHLDKVATELNAAIAATEPSSVERISLLALSALRTGDTDEALHLCDLSPEPSPWLEITRGFAHQLAGQDLKAREDFARAFAISPLGLLGALGHTLAGQIPDENGQTRPAHDPAMARRTGEYAATIPTWIDAMVQNPRSYQNLVVRITPVNGTPGKQADALSPLMATISLTNTAPIPLGMGSDRTINPRLLFAPNLETRRGNQRAIAEPEVVELTQRLRLMPGETMTQRAELDLGGVGFIAETASEGTSTLWWRVVQGFESRQGGMRDKGAGCLEATTDTLARAALPEATRTPAHLADRIAGSGQTGEEAADQAAPEIPALIIAARSMLARTYLSAAEHPGDALPIEVRSALASAIANAYASWPREARAMAVASLPPGRQVAALAALDSLALADADPMVRAVAIVSRVQSADDPAIAAAVASGDSALARVAAAHRDRLEVEARAFAERGFGRIFPVAP